jgi:hypothetical protein
MGSDDKKDAENVLFRKFFTTFDLTFTSLTLLHNEKKENSEGPFPLSKGLQGVSAICQFWALFP